MSDLSPDGSRVMFLTESTEVGFCGGCSPQFPRDRLAVVDVGEKEGGFVYVDGGVARVSDPVWSPGGDQIAFSGVHEKGNRDIFVATLERPFGAYNQVRALRLTDDPADDEFPAWSADGSTIFYDNLGEFVLDHSGFSYSQEIWSVGASGGAPRRLTHDSAPDAQPDVSSNGTVAYWHDGKIWTMNRDGSDQRRLTAVPAHTGFNPRWSPDGTMLALLRYDGSGHVRFTPQPLRGEDLPLMQVVVVKLSTGHVLAVGPRVASDLNPVSWTPDGSALLIDRYDSGA
jgi:Tol biopolymer transport system component